MNAIAIQEKSLEEFGKQLRERISNRFKPTLAIVFTSLKKEWMNLQELMDEKDIALFGASSNGEFIQEQYQVGSVSAPLLDMCPEYFRIEISDVDDEIKGLIDIWKVPSIGFFTFGEYGRVKNGSPLFHGTTVSWVILKEKHS